MRTTTESLLLWKQRIKERNKSGMSVSEWYRKNEISKIQKSDNEIVFAEVTSIISNSKIIRNKNYL